MQNVNTGIFNELTPFGLNLKKTLIELNKTQAWLAAQVGIGEGTITKLVRGLQSNPDYEARVNEFLADYMKEHEGQ